MLLCYFVSKTDIVTNHRYCKVKIKCNKRRTKTKGPKTKIEIESHSYWIGSLLSAALQPQRGDRLTGTHEKHWQPRVPTPAS